MKLDIVFEFKLRRWQKFLLLMALVFGLVVLGVKLGYSGKIVDLRFPDNLPSQDLNDRAGGLSDGGLVRFSDAHYMDASNKLAKSYGSHDQIINTAAQNDITNAWWTKNNQANSTANAIIGDAGVSAKSIQVSGQMSSNTTYVYSAKFKQGDQPRVRLQLTDASGARSAIFDLTDGSVNTQSCDYANCDPVDADGFYRCWIVESIGTVPGNSIDFQPITGAGAGVFAGDGVTVNTHVKEIQMEALPSANVIGPELFDQETLGSEVVGQDFTDGWATTGSTVVNSALEFDSNGGAGGISKSGIVAGTLYKLVWDFSTTASSVTIYITDSSYGETHSFGTGTSGTVYFIAEPTSDLIYIRNDDDGVTTFTTFSLTTVTAPDKSIPENDPWPAMAGSEAITASNDQNFESGTIGNWTATKDGSGTVTYDSTSLGYANENGSDKQGKIESSGDTYLAAALTTGYVTVSANTLYRLEALVAVPAANTNKDVKITASSAFSGSINSNPTGQTLSDDTWTKIVNYAYIAADNVGNFPIGFQGDPADGDIIYFDNVSIRPVQISWTPWTGSTNTVEIDESEDALKITYADHEAGAYVFFKDASDLSSDLTIGETYLITLDYKVTGAGMSMYTANAAGFYSNVPITETTWTSIELLLYADHATACYIIVRSMGAGDVAYIRNLSIKAVPDYALLEPAPYENSATISATPRFTACGLTPEGESTNLLYRSLDLTTSPWITVFITTPDPLQNETGIDGVENTAWTLEDNDGANYEYIYQAVDVSNDSEPYTFSYFVKKDNDETRFPTIQMFFSGGSTTLFRNFSINTKTGEVTAEAGLGAEAYTVDYGDWWRAVMTLSNNSTGNTALGVYIFPSRCFPAGTGSMASTGTVIVDYPQIEKKAYPTSPIPTLDIPATRTSEAADGTYGYEWTMSDTLKNILSNALPGGGATPAIGTLVVEWEALQDYDAEDTGFRGLVSTDVVSSLLYFHETEGYVMSTDGTNYRSAQIDWSRGDDLTTVVRWDDTADGGSGYLHVASKKNATWDLKAGTELAFDGAFGLSNDLLINKANELPICIKRIVIYDEYLSDDDLQRETWQTSIPIVRDVVQDVVQDVVKDVVNQ